MNNLKKTTVTTFIGICYGHSILFLSDAAICVLHQQDFAKIFSVFKWFWYALMGSYAHVFLFNQFKQIYLMEQETHPFEWKIGLSSVLFLGLFYSSIIVYPSEVLYSYFVVNDPLLLDRIFLGFPCGILTVCLFELSHMNQRIRDVLTLL
jgi:hypothetical protein